MKIIKRLLGTFFLIETIYSISMFLFSEEFRQQTVPAIMTIAFFALLAYVCLKKPKFSKSDTKSEHEASTNSSHTVPQKTTGQEIAIVKHRIPNTNSSHTIPQKTTGQEIAIAKHRIPNLTRLITESYQIMFNTDDPETLCSRYKFIVKNVNELCTLNQQGLFAQDALNQYQALISDNNYYSLILKCYQKYVNKARSELKTQKGVNSRINKFWQIIQENVDGEFYAARFKSNNDLLQHPFLSAHVDSEMISEYSSNETVNQDAVSSTSSAQYVETGKVIYRTDGKPITDEEVPYLMQVSHEKALERKGLYNGQILDISFMEERDKSKKEYTRIPTYQELSKIKTRDSYVSLAELSFLNYINGLPLVNPLIAQKWYYDYDLNYGKTIENLIANELLTVEHASIDRLNLNELKNILRHFNYPATGQKADLQSRIHKNIAQADIDSYFDNAKYFSITPKGKERIKRYDI